MNIRNLSLQKILGDDWTYNPDLIDCIEEGYYRYYNLNYHYSEEFLITRYYYLLASDLLVCFGTPKEHYQNLTELEIVNDRQMVSAIMENRTAHRESGCKICPSKNRMRLVHQTSSGFGWMFRRNGVFSNVVRGGKMSHIVYHESGSISDNQFSDAVFEDVEVELYGFSFAQNELRSVTFRNVTFDRWRAEDNRFVDCDTVEQGFGSRF